MADEGLTPEELAFKKKYGRLPPKKKAGKGPLARLHGKERKYFDSADHAMKSAGLDAENGNVIANPENIPNRGASQPSHMVRGTAAEDEGEEAASADPVDVHS